MYMKEAIEAAGKPFKELSPEEVGAALRKYEIHRSHRVAHIVGKSGMMGNIFMVMGYLVSTPDVCSLPQHFVCLIKISGEPVELPQSGFSTLSQRETKNAATEPHALPTPVARGPHNLTSLD